MEAIIHPSVHLSILDHFLRRSDDLDDHTESLVVGCLLGVLQSNSHQSVEITSTFAVPCTVAATLSDTQTQFVVELDVEYLQKMKRVQSRLMPNAQVVGWYTTGTKLSPHTATLHDLIVKECAHSCHHLLADCTSSSALGQVQAFYTSDIGAGESSTVGHVFLPFDSVRMLALSEENSAIQSMTTQSNNAMGSQVDTLTASLTSVRDMLDQVLVYTQSVVDKKVKPDVQIGRHLYTVMTTLTPHVDAQAFEEMFKSSVDEMELCMRIAQLTRAQLSVAEMLQKTAVIETPVTTAQ